jgi:hypothetical protein
VASSWAITSSTSSASMKSWVRSANSFAAGLLLGEMSISQPVSWEASLTFVAPADGERAASGTALDAIRTRPAPPW